MIWSRWICLGIGLGAFLWVQAMASVAMTQATPPPVSVPPAAEAFRPGIPAGRAGPPATQPVFKLRVPALSASTPPGTGEDAPSGRPRPLFRKTWFLAGLVVLAAGTVVLLASGGGDRERLPARESLPDFPPPPDLRLPVGAGGSVRGESR